MENNSVFLSESNQCNVANIKYVGPYRTTHEEPTNEELQNGIELAHALMKTVVANSYKICGQLFNYRVHTSESFIQNLYEFFYILMYAKFQLCFSPQYGFSLWPTALGFVKLQEVKDLLQNRLHIFFEDYITETTTFIRYHYECRFNYIFQSYKMLFLKQVVAALIQFGASISRQQLMTNCIKSALNMIYTTKIDSRH